MIRIVMLGRLGNNLFQYAMGRALAERHGVPFILDGSWFNRDGWAQVKCLKLLPGPAAGTVKIVRRWPLASRGLRRITGRHYWEFRRVPVFRESESDQSFDQSLKDAPDDCVLFGYFQTPLYFQGMENTLRQELSTCDLGLEMGHEALAEKLRNPESVAVHVRRTDYTGNPMLDICDICYYRDAMQQMRATVRGARFYIFSDDPVWCERNLTFQDAQIVMHRKDSSPLTDLHLMSLAAHHIIANSSYSWWAAWLGAKAGQKVLMPDRWLRGTKAPIEEKRRVGWDFVHVQEMPGDSVAAPR